MSAPWKKRKARSFVLPAGPSEGWLPGREETRSGFFPGKSAGESIPGPEGLDGWRGSEPMRDFWIGI